jgi:hypothetical protein
MSVFVNWSLAGPVEPYVARTDDWLFGWRGYVRNSAAVLDQRECFTRNGAKRWARRRSDRLNRTLGSEELAARSPDGAE